MVAQRALRRAAVAALVGSLLLGGLAVMPVHALGFTFNVNTTVDAIDNNVADPACDTGSGKCSLRAAIIQANALDPEGGRHRINVPAGTYTLTIGSPGEYNAYGGDLNVWQDVEIRGAGSGKTIIQASTTNAASGLDRLFDIREDGVTLIISGVTLRRGNSHASSGGAIAMSGTGQALRVESSVITTNTSITNDGGAIYANGSLTILDSTVSGNVSDGPAIEMWNGPLTIRRTTVSGNKVVAGTIRYAGGGSGIIERSTISGNTLLDPGDGMAVQLGRSSTDTTHLTIRNSTIAGNTSPGSSAAIGVRALNTMTIESTTIAGNTGFGIWPSAGTTVRNTLFAGNSLGNCDDPLPVSLGNNLDTGTTCGFDKSGDIESGKPLLGSLQDNGGSTKTRALGKGSDAIDTGKNCPAVDQRGVARPKDGDGDGTKRCDIGAYEAPRLILPTPTPVPPTPAPTATPVITAEPTVEPTTVPAESPVVTEAPTAAPVVSPAPTGAAQTEGPAATPGGPAASPQPEPAGGLFDGGALTWIVLLIVGLVLLLGLFLGLRRRKREPGAPGAGG